MLGHLDVAADTLLQAWTLYPRPPHFGKGAECVNTHFMSLLQGRHVEAAEEGRAACKGATGPYRLHPV